MTATALPQTEAAPKPSRARAFYQLTKPGIVLLVVLTGFPAAVLAAGAPLFALPWAKLALALAGTSLASASAAVFNQYFERERDKVMARTAGRPLPSGLVKPNEALAFAVGLYVLAMAALLATHWLAALVATASWAFYAFFYTLWLKDSSPQNIVVGGAPGASAPLICWAAMAGSIDLPAWLMFAIIFFWTPPHFWALAIYRVDDYVEAKLPMHPVVYGVPHTARTIALYALLLVPLTLLLPAVGAAGGLYFWSAMALGLAFLGYSAKVLVKPDRKNAIRLFAFSILYTLLLFAALGLDALWRVSGL